MNSRHAFILAAISITTSSTQLNATASLRRAFAAMRPFASTAMVPTSARLMHTLKPQTTRTSAWVAAGALGTGATAYSLSSTPEQTAWNQQIWEAETIPQLLTILAEMPSSAHRKAAVNSPGPEGEFLLTHAVIQGNPLFVRVLINNGADINAIDPISGISIVSIALTRALTIALNKAPSDDATLIVSMLLNNNPELTDGDRILAALLAKTLRENPAQSGSTAV